MHHLLKCSSLEVYTVFTNKRVRWETSSHPWEWIAARSIVAWRLINVEVRGQSAALQGDAYICMNIQDFKSPVEQLGIGRQQSALQLITLLLKMN